MARKNLESLDFVGETKLLNAAKLASQKLGMKFETIENRYGSIKRITGQNTEYEIRKREEYEDIDPFIILPSNGVKGHYLYQYLLYKMKDEKGFDVGDTVLESFNYASWNRFDETVELKKFTDLYLEDRLGREIFKILKKNIGG